MSSALADTSAATSGPKRSSVLGLAARWAGVVGFVLFVGSFGLARGNRAQSKCRLQ